MRVDNRIKNILVVLLLVLSVFSGLIIYSPRVSAAAIAVTNDMSTLDSCNATTGWTASANATAPSTDTTTYKEATASLNLGKDGTAFTNFSYNKTVSSANMNNKIFVVWLYIDNQATLNKINTARICLGNSTTWAWWNVKGSLELGWNNTLLTVASPDGGATDLTDVTRIKINFTTNNAGDTITSGAIKMDYLHYGATLTQTGGTDGSEADFDDFYNHDQSNALGVVDRQCGGQYCFNCRLVIGDGSTETWFADKEKQITFSSSINYAITIKSNAHFIIGELVDETLKVTKGGCHFITLYAAAANFFLICDSGSDTNLYSCMWTNPSIRSFIRHYPVRIWNCLFNKYFALYDTHDTNIYNVIAESGLYAIYAPVDCTFNEIFITDFTQLLYITIPSGSYTLKNIVGRKNGYVLLSVSSPADAYVYFIDPDIDSWTFSWSSSSATCYRQYTFNIIVQDRDGNPIQNANVLLKNATGGTVIDDTTDASGVIYNESAGSEHIVTYAFYNQTGGDTPYLQGPHELTISKTGYMTFQTNITIDHKIDQDAYTLGGSSYQDIIDLINEKWGNYNATQLMNYLIDIDANLTLVNATLHLVEGNLTDVYNLLVLVDGNVTAVYTLLQSVDGNVTTIYTLLQSVDTNVSSAYSLLQLVDGNLTSLTTVVNSMNTLLQSVDGNVTAVYTLLQSVDTNVTDVYTLLQSVDGNVTSANTLLASIDTLLKSVDGNLTTAYALLQSVDTNVSVTYALLQQMDGNLTNVYNLLSLADGNITTVYNLLQIVNSTTSDINGTVNTIYTLLQSVDGNVTNMYNLMVSMDGNLTAAYSLLVMVNQTVTNINATLNNANATLDYIRNTIWAGLVADDIYQQAKDANETIQWIKDNAWDGNNISDILDKWGAYAAADLYSISNQTYNISKFINESRWGSVYGSDLDKWGIYTATDLYSLSNQIKAISIYLNSTVWSTYTAQDLWIEANWANRTANWINGTKWNGYNASDLYIVSNATKIIAQYINYTCSRIHENTTRINQSVQQLKNGFRVVLTDFGEVLVGKKYRCQITVSNMTGSMVDADAAPTVSLYDPVLNAIVAGIAMTHEETGRYSYSYTTTAGQPDGEWTTITSTTVGGETVKNIEYWELEASPAEVKISVVDNTIPSIVGRINITNEGSSGYEYQYRWWITDVSDGQYGEPSMVDSGSSSKFINAGESFITDKTLTVVATGTYWFKVEVFWGTEISGASKQFDAVTAPAPPPCRPGPPGIPAPPAPPAPPPAPPYIAPIPPPGIPAFLLMLIIIAPVGSVFLILFLYYRKKEEEERRRY